ncbi:radical SAM protein [Paenibacillus sp. 1011MAR3C5]|uniref:radical SAM/SPASM domain-containing protein n=1 Tax=Paenibacillus sp. 1011MAR3C5 TaxID=1675787 RepID=UPI000E6D4998|nr:radical SAM/SPASM domain-containing protein [Paenibacillus sp. 1011MAR3C5]RJE90223.1 radical SAM protein [Paenibacillus sp. 1011MAR3C5]
MKKFKKFYIETTSICNLSCTFCPPTQRAKGFLSVEDFSRTLDQIKPYTDYIYFHVKGEPLLHPKIDMLLDIAHEKGFKVNITTNGTLITKNKAKLLHKPALRQINFSLHSFDGHPGSEDKAGYLADILAFVKEVQESSDVIISYRLWNLDMDNEVNKQKDKNRELLGMIEEAYSLDYHIEEKFKPGTGVKIADNIYLNQDPEFKWPDLKEPEDDGKGFCYALRNQAGVLIDGTVIPCCLDGEGVINLGNIHDKPFDEIIEGERATNLYDGFSRREAVEELCRKCGYRQRFGT